MLLKVLLLEDDPSKKGKLLTFLQSSHDLFERIDTALCTDDAERLLGNADYDLLIVDIVVPKVLGGEKDERNSIALLERLDEGAISANVPQFVLPVSSSTELSKSAHDFFIGRPWGILPYDEADNNALQSLEKIARFIASRRSTQSEALECDVFLITALMDPEFSAIEELELDWGPYEPLDAQHLVRHGSFMSGGQRRQLVAGFCHRMGPVQAAILATKALIWLRPKVVIMAGICAGIPSKTEIGDVVAVEVSWDWQSGKFIDSNGEEGFQIAPHQLDISDSSRNKLVLLKKDKPFWQSFAVEATKRKLLLPKLVIGPMATGSSVLADERVTERIKLAQHKNVVGLDMETYGVFAAVQSCSPTVPFLSLKAVCDKGDVRKDDEFQAYAASVSAKTAGHVLENYVAKLIDQ